ncbi:MAG TPA: PAS domain S-box protein, partial [Spirochaetia bacterium]|nr:PAS domain S-box protein [Spirochaetia bacterium]
TAEALLGALLVQHLAGRRRLFERVSTVFRFVVVSALASTAVSATTGVGVLTLGHYAHAADFGGIWLTWWLGDAVGDILFAPVILLFLAGYSEGVRWSAQKIFEAAILTLCVVCAGWFLFRRPSFPFFSVHFMCIPLLLWAAFRFSSREAALATLLLAVAAIPATIAGAADALYTGRQLNEMLLLLQGFLGVSAITTLAVAAIATEQRNLTEEVSRARDELEGKVKVAGRALAGVTAQADLTAVVLSRAEQIARTGSFRLEAATGKVTWSDQLHRIYGRSRAQFDGTLDGLLSFVHDEDQAMMRSALKEAVHEGKGFRVSGRIRRPDGEIRQLESIGEVVRNAEGNVSEVYGVCRDVTDEREAEARFQSLLESAPDAMVVVDRDGTILMVNVQTERITGYARVELVGQKVELLVPERSRARHTGHREVYFGSPSVRPMGAGLELFVRCRDGREFPAEISLSPLETAEGLLVTAAIRDITVRRQNENSIRQLTRRLLQVQDEEQQRISRELQSGVLRTLDEIRAQLMLVKDSGTVFDWRTSDAVRSSLDLVRKADKEARTLSYTMYPRLLEESGIAEALRYYTSGFQERAGIKVVLDAPSGLPRLSPEAERSLFRVVQESLANIQHHSGATTAVITLRAGAGQATLQIRDDGRGIPRDVLAAGGGTGIRGLAERMGHLGGRLEAASDGNGTVITATLPLRGPQ